MIDVSSLETQVLQAVGIVLMALFTWAGRMVVEKLHIEVATAQRAELEDVTTKALSWAVHGAMDTVKAKGWDHLDTKNQVISDATRYAINRFPDTLKRAGIDLTDTTLSAESLAGILQRKYPEITAQSLNTVRTVAVQQAATQPAIIKPTP